MHKNRPVVSEEYLGMPMDRRSAVLRVVGSGAALGGFCGGAFGQDKAVRVGTTLDMSGPQKVSGPEMLQGSKAFFNAMNRAGGVHGARIELVVKDDHSHVETAAANALAFQADPGVLALLHPLGTRQTAAIMDALQDLPIIGPMTGTTALRKKPSPNTFWVRASYDDEIEKLFSTAVTLGISRIGLIHPADPFGEALLAAFKASAERFKVQPTVIATTPNTGSTAVEAAAQAIAKAAPQVVIMGLVTAAAPHFIRALRASGGTSTVYGLSPSMGIYTLQELGDLAQGVGFSIVVPSPFAAKHEIVRRYQADMAASGFRDFSLGSLECYINAAVLAEGLRRAGPTPTRASLLLALERAGRFDLGGFPVQYGKGIREGSRFVDVAVMGRNGRFLT